MEEYKSDVDYWSTAHKGFDFEENDFKTYLGEAKLSTSGRKKDDFQLLKCDGLIEATENKNAEPLTSHILCPEEENYTPKLAKKYNPLELSVKENNQTEKLTASQTIKNMVLGMNYTLHPFKGKDEKIELLRTAVQSHDGNAILTVIMFLKNTLKKSIFQRELGMHTDAMNMYLSYLEEDHEIDELTNMFLLLNKPDSAAMIKYGAATSLRHPDRKIKMIDNCLSTHFQNGVVDSFLCSSVTEHKQLLRDQVAIEEYQLAADPDKKEDFNLYQQLTNERKLMDTSVMCSLVFCCLFYYGATEAAFISPAYTRTKYNLSKKQFTWGAVRALMASQKWSEMEDLFLSKSWLGGVKIKSCISFSRVLRLLSKVKAPHDIISKYVCNIDNPDLKMVLAKKYRCHNVVIEIFKNNRNRIGLTEYKSTLPPHSVDFCTAADILNNKAMKWKN